MKKIIFLIAFVLTSFCSNLALSQTSAAYLSNTSQPWGQSSIITAMNAIYPNDWTHYFYNSYDINQIFIPSRKLVFIEGGNSDTDFMISVLTTHQTVIENWVSNGGVGTPVVSNGYALWSFYASRKIDNEWTARVKLDNAFDRQYQLAYGYNTPGRGIYATLQYQPK